jgi:hypothetical protein
MRVVGSQIFGHDLKREGVSSGSNLGRWFWFGRCGHVFLFDSLSQDRARETPWPVAWTSSNASYGARNEARFPPTRPRLWEELVLWTYHGENRPREADDGEAARAVFNGGGDGVRWRSGSKDSSGSDSVGGAPPPSVGLEREAAVQRLDGGGVARQWRLGFGPNSYGIWHYL